MNINNAMRTVLAVAAGASELMAKFGECVQDNPATPVIGDAVCAATWIPVQYEHTATIVFIGLALILKVARPTGDGGIFEKIFKGLFGETAVVVDANKAGVGTVTPAQVASK